MIQSVVPLWGHPQPPGPCEKYGDLDLTPGLLKKNLPFNNLPHVIHKHAKVWKALCLEDLEQTR